MAKVDIRALAAHLQEVLGFTPGNPVYAFNPESAHMEQLCQHMEHEQPIPTPCWRAIIDSVAIPRTARGREQCIRLATGIMHPEDALCLKYSTEHETLVRLGFVQMPGITMGFAQVIPQTSGEGELRLVDCR